MAPKIGPRGITIEDVVDVANNGIRQTSATPYRSARFENAQPTATSPVDYAALLAGGPAPTYGQKYGGQPTGEYARQMILGAAMQAKSVGDLAALQAATNTENLTNKFASDLLTGTNKLSPIFRKKFSQPLVTTPGTRNYVPSPEVQSAQQLSDLENELNDLYVTSRIGNQRTLAMGTDPTKVRALQSSIDQAKRTLQYSGYSPAEETLNAQRSQAEAVRQTAENKQNAYGAYMDRMNMLDPSTGGTIPEMLRAGAQRQTATNLTPGLEAALAEQVTPYETVAQGFANTPLSQFAQQIAVNRYGYDPALAAGLFDTSVDIQSLKDEADLFAAQNPQLNMSPAEIVYNQLGEEGLNQYLQQQAEQALIGSPSQQRTEAELAQDAANAPIDAELYSVYATAPGDVGSALNSDVARQYMSDPNFLAQFQAGTTKIYDDMSQGLSGADAVNSYMQNYLDETGDPVSARILEELLSNVSFG